MPSNGSIAISNDEEPGTYTWWRHRHASDAKAGIHRYARIRVRDENGSLHRNHEMILGLNTHARTINHSLSRMHLSQGGRTASGRSDTSAAATSWHTPPRSTQLKRKGGGGAAPESSVCQRHDEKRRQATREEEGMERKQEEETDG